jgi:hypothetical protein
VECVTFIYCTAQDVAVMRSCAENVCNMYNCTCTRNEVHSFVTLAIDGGGGGANLML